MCDIYQIVRHDEYYVRRFLLSLPVVRDVSPVQAAELEQQENHRNQVVLHFPNSATELFSNASGSIRLSQNIYEQNDRKLFKGVHIGSLHCNIIGQTVFSMTRTIQIAMITLSVMVFQLFSFLRNTTYCYSDS